MKDIFWYEVWADDGLVPPYILLLMCYGEDDLFHVYDVAEKKIIFQAKDYETAMYWLLEDEYRLVSGRITPDE